MPFNEEGRFVWEFPATVVSVIDGATFLAEVDLGFDVSIRRVVAVSGLSVESVGTRDGMEARKEAQRLLNGAQLLLRPIRLGAIVEAEVMYSPWHQPRSEQGSFVASMLASGHATL